MMRPGDPNNERVRPWPARLLVIAAVVAGGAAPGCKDDGVGLGEGTAAPTTGPATSVGDDQPDDGDDFPDDGDDQPDDGGDTTTEGGDTTVADSMGGTDSSGGESTGCMIGTEGCACADADPGCEDDLLCIDDVCVTPLCPADTEEPDNNSHLSPVDLGDFTDGDPGGSIISQLSGSDDVDWWFYDCQDTLGEEVDPARDITQPSPLRVCKYMDCAIGGNPLFDCPAGTTEDMAPFDFLPGCCTSDGNNFDLADYNCPDSSDDSVIVYIKVDQSELNNCVDYQIDFSC